MGLTNSKDFTPKAVDSFFFDTNVWLLLFGDVANFQKKEQARYSKALKSILDRDSIIFLTSNVISEFSNVLLKKEYNLWRKKPENLGKDYKRDFVGSEIYLQQVELISSLITTIVKLPCLQRIPDDFNAVNLNRILKRFKTIDFNDAYIAEICQSKSLKLITNDRDFFSLKGELDIISALA
ncbi:PIN domain-containing protein [Mesonia sp.]|uniref:PIN domain-containing protein n=1 Tax=Mesonia sp. TaxID=1960830 RepID=UPI003F9D9EAD